VGAFDQLLRRAAASEYNFYIVRSLIQKCEDVLGLEQPKPDGDIDLVEHDDVVLS
jgi:hypothetical protein